jgi:hypothetical protein
MSVVIPRFRRGLHVMYQQSSSPGQRVVAGMVLGRMRLATEAVGAFNLTLTNVVVGSQYEIEDYLGASITMGTAAASSVALSIPVYAANNTIKIKVRKATASPFYQPYETQATAVVGAQSIFVNQLSDE